MSLPLRLAQAVVPPGLHRVCGLHASTLHGKARWMGKREQARFLAPTHTGLALSPTARLSADESYKNLVLVAPTGSGKTLASFTAIINELYRRDRETADGLDNAVYCLYVSPLKSLANDIHRNLEVPLDAITDGEFRQDVAGRGPVGPGGVGDLRGGLGVHLPAALPAVGRAGTGEEQGAIELRVSDAGVASGNLEGPLGTLQLRGEVHEQTLRARISPQSTDAGDALHGFIVAEHQDGTMKGELRASSGGSTKIRGGVVELEKAGE